MAACIPFATGVPSILAHGSPCDVDRFLLAALWGRSDSRLPLLDVVAWAAVLRGRGKAFASHVATCGDWLYEHAANFPELLRAWEAEQRARAAVRRSVVALQRQRALVDRIARIGGDASHAYAVLESMEEACRVFGEMWETRAAILDRLTRCSNATNRPARTSVPRLADCRFSPANQNLCGANGVPPPQRRATSSPVSVAEH